ncbi:hypothetical protein GW17_00061373 [Ensete ventricosum]|nr:hypothetical protein GW17_00061373 [Ensete ventricosum]
MSLRRCRLDLCPRATGGEGARGEKSPAGGEGTWARYFSSSSLFFFSSSFFFLFPFSFAINRRRLISPSIDCRWSILTVLPGSGRSTYWSAARPVCTRRYEPYRSVRKTVIKLTIR